MRNDSPISHLTRTFVDIVDLAKGHKTVDQPVWSSKFLPVNMGPHLPEEIRRRRYTLFWTEWWNQTSRDSSISARLQQTGTVQKEVLKIMDRSAPGMSIRTLRSLWDRGKINETLGDD